MICYWYHLLIAFELSMVRSTFRTGYCQRIIPYDSSATVRQDSGRERTNTGRIPVVLARLKLSVGGVVVLGC